MFRKKRRFSIARLMVIISILAVEFGLLRLIFDRLDEDIFLFLPSLNFMLLGLPKLRRGDEARPFWIGFEASAMIQIGLVGGLFWYAPAFLSSPLNWLNHNKWLSSDELLITWIFVIYALPQLLIASMIGWLSARYRLVIERRPSLVDTAIEGRTDILRALPTFGESPLPAVE